VGAQDVAGEPSVSGAGLDHDVRIGCAELLPTSVQRAGDAGAEQRSDLGAGDEVAVGAAGTVTGREEPDVRVVQGDVDETVERDGTLASDQPRDRVGGRAR
jgi:hypothetical protein